MRPASPEQGPVLYFDGVCTMCNAAVDFVIQRDHAAVFRFASLQGDTARAQLGIVEGQSFGTLVVVDGGVRLERSAAVLKIVAALGWPWRALAVFGWVPVGLRDALYDFVAARRFRWFGRKDACRLPSAAERARFLP